MTRRRFTGGTDTVAAAAAGVRRVDAAHGPNSGTGQDTRKILSELARTDDQIDKLVSDGIAGLPPEAHSMAGS